MAEKLISAQQARENASRFKIPPGKIESQIAEAIELASTNGRSAATTFFSRRGFDTTELERVLAAVREKGFSIEVCEPGPHPEQVWVRITW